MRLQLTVHSRSTAFGDSQGLTVQDRYPFVSCEIGQGMRMMPNIHPQHIFLFL